MIPFPDSPEYDQLLRRLEKAKGSPLTAAEKRKVKAIAIKAHHGNSKRVNTYSKMLGRKSPRKIRSRNRFYQHL